VVRADANINGRRVGASFEVRRKRRVLSLLSYQLGVVKKSP